MSDLNPKVDEVFI